MRVCGTRFKVYTTLDWARQVLGVDDAHGAGQEMKDQGKVSFASSPKKVFTEESQSIDSGKGLLSGEEKRGRPSSKMNLNITAPDGSNEEPDSSGMMSKTTMPAGERRLLASEDNIHAFKAKQILEEAFFDVHLSRDGRQAINNCR